MRGLARSEARAAELRGIGIEPVIGTLDDTALLSAESASADAVVNAASADHRPAAEAILAALAGTGKPFLHTSGSSIVGNRAGGEARDDVYDETTPLTPALNRAARVALNQDILAGAEKGVRAVVLCPALIYGLGHGIEPHSMQVPWLIALARKYGVAKHAGPGANIWSNVHIDDLTALYLLALEKAPAGGVYFAENGENSMREVCVAIGRMLGHERDPEAMTMDEAADEWGEGPANDTMGSNSRVRAVAARRDLGWNPGAPSLLDEIERGCYAGNA